MPEIRDTTLTWAERVAMLSVNPEAADKDDVARMAAELMEARNLIVRLGKYLEHIGREAAQTGRGR